MNRWIVEDWAFDVEVIDGEAKNCRLGLEKETFFILNTKHLKVFALVP